MSDGRAGECLCSPPSSTTSLAALVGEWPPGSPRSSTGSGAWRRGLSDVPADRRQGVVPTAKQLSSDAPHGRRNLSARQRLARRPARPQQCDQSLAAPGPLPSVRNARRRNRLRPTPKMLPRRVGSADGLLSTRAGGGCPCWWQRRIAAKTCSALHVCLAFQGSPAARIASAQLPKCRCAAAYKARSRDVMPRSGSPCS